MAVEDEQVIGYATVVPGHVEIEELTEAERRRLPRHLLRVDERRLLEDSNLLGPVLESFVATELLRQATWHAGAIELLHYRTDTDEVDIVLEDASGRIVGIEVKATPTPTMADFAGLRALSAAAGPSFHRGVLLHTGTVSAPFGRHMWAAPVGSLWAE